MNEQVREAPASEEDAISDVLLAAFGEAEGREIAELVDALLEDPSAEPLLSLIATSGDRVVGYVLFTSTRIEGPDRPVPSAILAPLAVHPDCQGWGIGGQLICEGLERLGAAGVELVFVLGDPDYYARHGFAAAGVEGFEAPHPIAPENAGAWMVRALHPGVIGRVHGRVLCADALADPRHWQE